MCGQVTSKETSIQAITKLIQQEEQAYILLLQQIRQSADADMKDHVTGALDALKRATLYAAHGVRSQMKHAAFHLLLGKFIEEEALLRHRFHQNIQGTAEAGGLLVKGGMAQSTDDDDDELDDGTCDQGSSINKEDDIRAICELHGVSRNAAITAVLKALDAEYHQLKEVGNFTKADYVQGLYSLKGSKPKPGKARLLVLLPRVWRLQRLV